MSGAAAPQHPLVREPSPPRRPLPSGACDVHAHVFGPYERFPLASDRTYTPPAAPLELYLDMLDKVGFARGVLVHASAYGLDCSALMNALANAGARLRGVAVATSATTDAELEQMRRLGVRGLRFSQFDDPALQARFKNSIGFDQLVLLGPRLRALGLHAQIWGDCATFVRAAPSLLALGIPLVLDHMGYFDVERGTGAPPFQTLLGLLADGRVWVKLSANRNTKRFPNFEDVRPFHEALLRANPGRLLWGSDWPFLGMAETTPDVGHLIDLLDEWTADEVLRHRILAANPATLYGWGALDASQ